MNINTLKEKFTSGIERWTVNRIDDMVKANPAFAVPSVYIKRAARNIIAKNKACLEGQIDNVALFLADENGEINAETVFEDLTKMLTAMEPKHYNMGLISGTVGGGNISIDLPDNIITTIMFGSKKSISITPNDLVELKNILTEDIE